MNESEYRYESDAEYKGFDTETTGLDIWLHGTDRLTGIILSIDDTSATYLPILPTLLFMQPMKSGLRWEI